MNRSELSHMAGAVDDSTINIVVVIIIIIIIIIIITRLDVVLHKLWTLVALMTHWLLTCEKTAAVVDGRHSAAGELI